MVRIEFEGHPGELDIASGHASFYGHVFVSINAAAKFLGPVPYGSGTYRGWWVSSKLYGVMHVEENMWYTDGIWYTEEGFRDLFSK
jgi:hypothetical protein